MDIHTDPLTKALLCSRRCQREALRQLLGKTGSSSGGVATTGEDVTAETVDILKFAQSGKDSGRAMAAAEASRAFRTAEVQPPMEDEAGSPERRSRSSTAISGELTPGGEAKGKKLSMAGHEIGEERGKVVGETESIQMEVKFASEFAQLVKDTLPSEDMASRSPHQPPPRSRGRKSSVDSQTSVVEAREHAQRLQATSRSRNFGNVGPSFCLVDSREAVSEVALLSRVNAVIEVIPGQENSMVVPEESSDRHEKAFSDTDDDSEAAQNGPSPSDWNKRTAARSDPQQHLFAPEDILRGLYYGRQVLTAQPSREKILVIVTDCASMWIGVVIRSALMNTKRSSAVGTPNARFSAALNIAIGPTALAQALANNGSMLQYRSTSCVREPDEGLSIVEGRKILAGLIAMTSTELGREAVPIIHASQGLDVAKKDKWWARLLGGRNRGQKNITPLHCPVALRMLGSGGTAGVFEVYELLPGHSKVAGHDSFSSDPRTPMSTMPISDHGGSLDSEPWWLGGASEPVSIRTCALKVFFGQRCLERRDSEVQLMSDLANKGVPSIPTIISTGSTSWKGEEQAPYMVFEPVAEEIDTLNPRMLLDVIKALKSCHKAGIVHCDVSPSNIMMHDGKAILIDFGLSRKVGATLDLASTPQFAGNDHIGSIEAGRPHKYMPFDDLAALVRSVMYFQFRYAPEEDGSDFVKNYWNSLLSDNAFSGQNMDHLAKECDYAGLYEALQKYCRLDEDDVITSANVKDALGF